MFAGSSFFFQGALPEALVTSVAPLADVPRLGGGRSAAQPELGAVGTRKRPAVSDDSVEDLHKRRAVFGDVSNHHPSLSGPVARAVTAPTTFLPMGLPVVPAVPLASSILLPSLGLLGLGYADSVQRNDAWPVSLSRHHHEHHHQHQQHPFDCSDVAAVLPLSPPPAPALAASRDSLHSDVGATESASDRAMSFAAPLFAAAAVSDLEGSLSDDDALEASFVREDDTHDNNDDGAHEDDDPYGMADYTEDIYRHLRESEMRLRPLASFMEVQRDINPQMRAILVDWLVEVCAEFRLTITTLHTAVAYLDRFLAAFVVQRRRLQLVGITCLLVAAKYEEVESPSVRRCVSITNNSYSAEQVLSMEQLVLRVLQYRMTVVTPVSYSERYLEVCPTADDQMESLFQYLVELTLKDADVFLRYRPSMIAAAAISLSLLILGQPIWSPMLALYSGLSVAHIAACATDLYYTLSQAPLRRQRAVIDKYSSQFFGHVATLPIPPFPQDYVH